MSNPKQNLAVDPMPRVAPMSAIVTIEHVARLWGQLTSLRIDIESLKIAGDNSDTLRDREIKALQVAMELRAACGGRLQ